jgi:hypothetical protein
MCVCVCVAWRLTNQGRCYSRKACSDGPRVGIVVRIDGLLKGHTHTHMNTHTHVSPHTYRKPHAQTHPHTSGYAHTHTSTHLPIVLLQQQRAGVAPGRRCSTHPTHVITQRQQLTTPSAFCFGQYVDPYRPPVEAKRGRLDARVGLEASLGLTKPPTTAQLHRRGSSCMAIRPPHIRFRRSGAMPAHAGRVRPVRPWAWVLRTAGFEARTRHCERVDMCRLHRCTQGFGWLT